MPLIPSKGTGDDENNSSNTANSISGIAAGAATVLIVVILILVIIIIMIAMIIFQRFVQNLYNNMTIILFWIRRNKATMLYEEPTLQSPAVYSVFQNVDKSKDDTLVRPVIMLKL